MPPSSMANMTVNIVKKNLVLFGKYRIVLKFMSGGSHCKNLFSLSATMGYESFDFVGVLFVSFHFRGKILFRGIRCHKFYFEISLFCSASNLCFFFSYHFGV